MQALVERQRVVIGRGTLRRLLCTSGIAHRAFVERPVFDWAEEVLGAP